MQGAAASDVQHAIRDLLQQLSEDERNSFIRSLSRELPATGTPKAGDILDAISRTIEAARGERQHWSAADLKKVVVDQGIPAKPKEIYNAISYLARRGRIRQVGYGQYVLMDYGAGLVTPDDVGLPPGADE